MTLRQCPQCNNRVPENIAACPVCKTVLHDSRGPDSAAPQQAVSPEKSQNRAILKKCPSCNLLQDGACTTCPVCGFNLTKVPIATEQTVEKPDHTGFWLRFIATAIDTFLILGIVIPCMLLSYGSSYFSSDAIIKGPLDLIITWLLPAVAVILFWIVRGATPGKMFISAKIVDARTGKQASPMQLIGRYYAYIISALPLGAGFIWIAFDKQKQGWHDKLMGTMVMTQERPAAGKRQ